MGSLLSKACGGTTPPLLSLNDTCQRLRCLMACCGGKVNVLSREHDVTDAGIQTENEEEEGKDKEDKEDEEDETTRPQETSV